MSQAEPSLDDISSVVQGIYDQVLASFVVWKADYAKRILAAASLTPKPLPIATLRLALSNDPLVQESSSIVATIQDSDDYVEYHDLETGQLTRVRTETTRIVASAGTNIFAPAPVYEYCSTVERSNHHGDDASKIPFIPFPEDPTFDLEGYFGEFSGLAWSIPQMDPDLEAVVIETLRRLHAEHGLDFRAIAETGVLPLDMYKGAHSQGVIHMSSRRDYFAEWPSGVSAIDKPLPSQTQMADTVEEAASRLVTEFCTNLNCLTGFCTTHLDPLPQPLPGPAPTIRNDRLHDLVKEPCGTDCFLHLEPEDETLDVDWDDKAMQLFQFVIKHSGDTLPCDLATICGKPCFEAYSVRCREVHVPRRALRGGKAKNPIPLKNNLKTFADFDAKQYTPGPPCGHPGPCNAAKDCPCVRNGGHCESGCRCGPNCVRRWRGCNCVPRSGGKAHLTCRTKSCECFLANRECDPEMCAKCRAKDCTVRVCRNTDIQRAVWKKTKIGNGSFGLGLFMEEPVVEGDLIIEYMGQVIYEETVDSRDPIAIHRHRNYVFQLNKTLSIDGTYAGNRSRYVNHDEQRPNCEARILLVNGEHRIGLFATRQIRVDEEVLFDYGPSFFQNEKKGELRRLTIAGSQIQ